MKKFILMSAVAGLLLASCSFEESRVEKKQIIELTAAPYSAQTKAEHDLNQTFKNPFRVYAWNADNNFAVIDGKKATWQDGINGWSIEDGPYYWPDFPLEFVAIVPADNNVYTAVNRSIDGNTNITYTFDAEHQNPRNVNLMHSDFTEEMSSGTVKLGFRHALALVEVIVKQVQNVDIDESSNIESYEVVLNSMKVVGIRRQGTYSVTSNDQNVKNSVWSYLPTDPMSDIVYLSDNRSLCPGGTYQDFEPNEGEDIFVMPQNLENDAKFIIEYQVITHTKNGNSSSPKKIVEIQLNTITEAGTSTAISSWQTNKKIRYTINITPTDAALAGIQFEAIEEEWGNIYGDSNITYAN